MAKDNIKRQLRPGREKIASNVWYNIRMGRPQVNFHVQQYTPIILCAGGGSLLEHVDEIQCAQLKGMDVVCVGNAGHALMRHGIKVNGHILVDGAVRNRSFIVPTVDTRYFVASQCDPSILHALHRHKHVFIWHAGCVADEQKDLDLYYGKSGWFQILGGSYVTLRAISLLHCLGYKYIHIYGFDSCLSKEDKHHAYDQPNADRQKSAEVEIGGRKFKANFWMLDQASQFCESVQNKRFGDSQLAIHGNGLIAHMVKTRSLPTWQLQTQPSYFSTPSRINLAQGR